MKLHDQVKHYQRLVRAQADTIDTIQQYVLSDKFAHDNQCNVNDIMLRLLEGKQRIQAIDDEL